MIDQLLGEANATDDGTSSVNSAKRVFLTSEAAREFFGRAARRLTSVEEWGRHSSLSSYAMFDADGRETVGRPAAVGDLIRINIHGSGKYDWVEVISLRSDADEIVLTVKPSNDPTAETVDRSRISHFFVAEARNNFCLRYDDSFVEALVIGLNERTNTADTANIVETMRNATAANLGSYLGLQNAMWTEFCKNLLDSDGD